MNGIEQDPSILEIPDLHIDLEREEIFNNICYYVRNQKMEELLKAKCDLPNAYAADLINEIQRRHSVGDLNIEDYRYCIRAAQEILNMELILFQSQFETMR